MAKRELGTNLDKALTSWGKLNSDLVARKMVLNTIESLTRAEGTSIARLYEGADGRYVAVIFDNGSDKIDAYINVGFIHHSQRALGATFDAERKMWRTQLPSGSAASSSSAKAKSIEVVMCPLHFEPHPLTASCPQCAKD